MNTHVTVLGQHNTVDIIVATLPTTRQSRSAEYRAQAAECLEIANRWPDLIKDQYELLARQWLVVAEQSERCFN
jgi:hypothetical protein